MKYLILLLFPLLLTLSSFLAQDTTYYEIKDGYILDSNPPVKVLNKKVIKEITTYSKKDNSKKVITGYYPSGELKYIYNRSLNKNKYMPDGIDKQFYKNGKIKSIAKYEYSISYPPVFFKRYSNTGELYQVTKSSKILPNGRRKNTYLYTLDTISKWSSNSTIKYRKNDDEVLANNTIYKKNGIYQGEILISYNEQNKEFDTTRSGTIGYLNQIKDLTILTEDQYNNNELGTSTEYFRNGKLKKVTENGKVILEYNKYGFPLVRNDSVFDYDFKDTIGKLHNIGIIKNGKLILSTHYSHVYINHKNHQIFFDTTLNTFDPLWRKEFYPDGSLSYYEIKSDFNGSDFLNFNRTYYDSISDTILNVNLHYYFNKNESKYDSITFQSKYRDKNYYGSKHWENDTVIYFGFIPEEDEYYSEFEIMFFENEKLKKKLFLTKDLNDTLKIIEYINDSTLIEKTYERNNEEKVISKKTFNTNTPMPPDGKKLFEGDKFKGEEIDN